MIPENKTAAKNINPQTKYVFRGREVTLGCTHNLTWCQEVQFMRCVASQPWKLSVEFGRVFICFWGY